MRAVLILGGMLLTAPVLAYSAPPPHSFAKPTGNGKYVLVMLQPQGLPRDKELKAKYPQSGLYPVDDPKKPAWTCDWAAQKERNVFASDDGVYAVRVLDLDSGLRHWVLSYEKTIPPKAAGWDDAPALMIYKNGQPFRTLALKDVFDTPRFTDRDCFEGPIVSIDSFQDAEGRVAISTEAREKKQTATIDFRKGEAVEKGQGGGFFDGAVAGGDENAGGSGPRWGRIILVGLVVVVFCTAAFAGLAFFLIQKQRKQKA